MHNLYLQIQISILYILFFVVPVFVVKFVAECLPLGGVRYPTYEINFKTSAISTDENFAKVVIRKANELASKEYVQIFNREFEYKTRLYNKQFEKNLKAIEFLTGISNEQSEISRTQLGQLPPLIDELTKKEITFHMLKADINKYNLEQLDLSAKYLRKTFEQNSILPLFKFKKISNIKMEQPSISYSVILVACLIMSFLVVFLSEYVRQHFSTLSFSQNKGAANRR